MSHSRVFDEFAKILANNALVKTADKKDQSYNVVPVETSAPVEETGYELVEIAHPDQIQVAESRLNDGVVENGVEAQKIMIDVARRNPRGVLAEVMSTLVKVANVLEDEMTEESLKIAKEVDDFLVVLAQQAQPLTTVNTVGEGSTTDVGSGVASGVGLGGAMLLGGPLGWAIGAGVLLNEAVDYAHKKVGDLYEGFRKAATYLRKLDFGGWTTTLSSQTDAQKKMEANIANIANTLDGYGQLGVSYVNEPDKLILETYKAIQFLSTTAPYVTEALKQTTDLSGDPRKAEVVWNRAVSFAQEWLNVTRTKAEELKAKNGIPATPSKGQPQGAGVSSKGPAAAPSSHHYSLDNPLVKELQQLVGAEQDGKFGQHTFDAVIKETTDDYLLKEYIHSKPELAKGYRGWTSLEDVQNAINKINQYKQSVPKKETAPAKAPMLPSGLMDTPNLEWKGK